MVKSVIDVHTHTLVSGHAFCTLKEMVDTAVAKNLEIYGITEHGPSIPGTCDPLYFRNMYLVPRHYGNTTLLLGAELNIIDYLGTIDLDERYMSCLDIKIAGLHGVCYKSGTREENTSALIGAIENPYINIISHPCDGTASDFDIEAVVLASKRCGTLLELNNQSLNPHRHKKYAIPYNLEMLKLCKKHDVHLIMGSDAHHTSYIADYQYLEPLLKETDFPDELIVNDKPGLFMSIINGKSTRLQ